MPVCKTPKSLIVQSLPTPDPHSKQLRFDVSIYLQSQNPKTLKSQDSAVLQSEHFNYPAPNQSTQHPTYAEHQNQPAKAPRKPQYPPLSVVRVFKEQIAIRRVSCCCSPNCEGFALWQPINPRSSPFAKNFVRRAKFLSH